MPAEQNLPCKLVRHAQQLDRRGEGKHGKLTYQVKRHGHHRPPQPSKALRQLHTGPTGFNEAIPAGEGVRECGFHTSFRQLQEHHQIVDMFRQMSRKASLPVIGARVTGHPSSRLRALVHPPIAKGGPRIFLKGRGQGLNFLWGRRDTLKMLTFFRNFFQKGDLCAGLRIGLWAFERAKDPAFFGMPSRLAKDRLIPAGHIACASPQPHSPTAPQPRGRVGIDDRDRRLSWREWRKRR